MRKVVKIKPFGIFSVSEEVLQSVEANKNTTNGIDSAIKAYIKSVKSGGTGQFIGINSERKELFTFIPLIKGDKLFAARFPDPIQLYFSSAYSYFEFAEQTRNNIIFQGDQEGPINWVNEYLYNWHLNYKISSVIFLHLTIEAFINYSMPEDFVYIQKSTGGGGKKFINQINEFDKAGVEKFIEFKEKLRYVIPQFCNLDIYNNHKKVYDKLLELNELRNDVIHLRSFKNEKNMHYFHEVFDRVINIELNSLIQAAMDFINLVSPDFITLIDAGEREYNGSATFEFDHYKAFKLDISIFLKIIEIDAELITIILPLDTGKEYNKYKNWIMQNLDIMAREQWIYFPEIIKTENTVTIKIVKTKDRLLTTKEDYNPVD